MKITQQRTGPAAVVTPQGAIIGVEADQLSTLLTQLMAEGAHAITIDLSDVSFVDSRGLEVLMEAGEQLIRAGKPLRLAGANDILREVLRLTGLAPLFEFVSTAGSIPQAGQK
jgi:anti-anti-sigma factor